MLWGRARIVGRTFGVGSAVLVGGVAGAVLATRANYGLLLAPLVVLAWKAGKPREATVLGAVAVGVAGALTLPFYIADPGHFTPLSAVTKVTDVEAVLPGAGFVIPGVGLVVAVVLAWVLADRGTLGFLLACAAPQVALVVPVVVLLGLGGYPAANYSLYGLAFSWFLVIGAIAALYGWPTTSRSRSAPREAAFDGLRDGAR
jgi:hypothetical protein